MHLCALLPNEPNGQNPLADPNLETRFTPPEPMVQGDDSPVVVWTNRGCGACVQAKRLLDSKRVTYKERRLKNTPEVQRAFARATGGARTVPQIIVAGKSVGGFDDLLNLDRSGELDVLLGRAQPSEKSSILNRFKNVFRR